MVSSGKKREKIKKLHGWGFKPYVNMNVDEITVSQEIHNYFLDLYRIPKPKNQEDVKNFKKKRKISMSFTAIKDQGVDIVVVPNVKAKTPKCLRIQIKGSKYHLDENPSKSRGWFTLSKDRVYQYYSMTDYIIFMVWQYEIPDGKPKLLKPFFLVIPIKDFIKFVKTKKIEGKKGYNFYFQRVVKDGKEIAFEDRDAKEKGEINLTKYLNAWHLLK